MRTFEVLLILVNALSLLLSFSKKSKKAWLGAAGVNLALLLIHGLFEGFRYQMMFSYTFVILIVPYILFKTQEKFFKTKTPIALRLIAISLSLILLASSALLAYTLPVFKLPKPTGSYDIGVKYFHLIDENRNDPFLDKAPQKRELMIKVYYPAVGDSTKPFNRYFHSSTELIKLFARFYGMPDFALNHFSLIKTYSKDELKLSNKESSYPVVLFSHGGGTSMEIQTAQCEDLASHGYIVAAIDHTYISAATAFPNRVVWHREATTEFNSPEPAEILTKIMADDSRFIMDELERINDGKMDSMFKGKLDLDKIGVIGHSLGGAAAYDLALNDSRIKAAINLDGRVFITPKAEAKNIAPFLMLANDKFHVQGFEKGEGLLQKFEDLSTEEQDNALLMYTSKEAYNEAYIKAQQCFLRLTEVLKVSGSLYTIKGSDHMKFTDLGFFIGLKQLNEMVGIGGETTSARCLEISESVTASFFDQHLKNEQDDSLKPLLEKYPELKKVELK